MTSDNASAQAPAAPGSLDPEKVPRIDVEGMSREILLSLYATMEKGRQFEEKLYYLFLTGIMPGTMHQATGQEAVAAGICGALRQDDTITSTHRGHVHCIAKGVPVRDMMCEMFARKGYRLAGRQER